MKLIKLTTLFFLLSISHLYGQNNFYNNISIEIGISRAKTINTSSITPSFEMLERRNMTADDFTETSAYSNNISMSFGYALSENHHIRIRHSYNDLANYVSGNFGFQGFCSVGESPVILNHDLNLIKSKSWGIYYEYQSSIISGQLAIGAGLEKQWNNVNDMRIFVPGILYQNYSLHSSIGYLIPFTEFIKFHPKFFVTKSFENKLDPSFFRLDGKFIPIQIGIELGVRLDFSTF